MDYYKNLFMAYLITIKITIGFLGSSFLKFKWKLKGFKIIIIIIIKSSNRRLNLENSQFPISKFTMNS